METLNKKQTLKPKKPYSHLKALTFDLKVESVDFIEASEPFSLPEPLRGRLGTQEWARIWQRLGV